MQSSILLILGKRDQNFIRNGWLFSYTHSLPNTLHLQYAHLAKTCEACRQPNRTQISIYRLTGNLFIPITYVHTRPQGKHHACSHRKNVNCLNFLKTSIQNLSPKLTTTKKLIYMNYGTLLRQDQEWERGLAVTPNLSSHTKWLPKIYETLTNS